MYNVKYIYPVQYTNTKTDAQKNHNENVSIEEETQWTGEIYQFNKPTDG